MLDRQPDVDVVVSSNGSQDGTNEFLLALPKRDRFRVVIQPHNLGPNIHIGWLYGQGTGRFSWLFGDDDLFDPEMVPRLLQVLRERPDLSWIHLPHVFVKASGEESVVSEMPPEDLYVNDARALYARYAQWFTFISSNIYARSSLLSALPKMTLTSPYWPWSLAIYCSIGKPAAVLSGKWVKAGPEITWRDSAFEVGSITLIREVYSHPRLSRRERCACVESLLAFNPQKLDRALLLAPGYMCKLLVRHPSLARYLLSPRWLIKLGRRAIGARRSNPS